MEEIIPRLSDDPTDPHPERETNGRIALALSILQHRSFCPACRKNVDDARLALLGASIEELREGIPD